MSTRDDRMGRLFDLLAATPDGVTVDQIKAHLECDHPAANQAIRDLRLALGESDELTVPCYPQGQGERWLYVLAHGTLVVDDDEPEGQWIANRLGDAKARIETMAAVANAAVRDTDGRTPLGREARVLAKALGRLREDLAEIRAETNRTPA